MTASTKGIHMLHWKTMGVAAAMLGVLAGGAEAAVSATGAVGTTGGFSLWQGDLFERFFTRPTGEVVFAAEPVEYTRVNGIDVVPNLPDRDYVESFGVRTLAQGQLYFGESMPGAVVFGYRNPARLPYTLNEMRFEGASVTEVAFGDTFRIGTIRVTNGIWFASAEADLTVRTVSDDPAFDGHAFTDTLRYVVTVNEEDGFGGSPENRADYVEFVNRPALGRIRVLEAVDADAGPNTGTVELWGRIGSLEPLYLANAQGGVFVQAVPEPGTWVMLVAGLLGVGAMTRRRAGTTSA